MLTLVGLDPAAKGRYSWVGDDACNREASDVVAWMGTGTGLVAHDGQQMTEIVWEALRPTTLQIVLNHSAAGIRALASPSAEDFSGLTAANMPAVYRMAVAYGVTGCEHGPSLARGYDAGGMRLTNAALDSLEGIAVSINGIRIRLMDHLGGLILAASLPTDSEKKV